MRRVWSLKGVRIVTPVECRFEWGYLIDALEVGSVAMRVVTVDGASFHHRDGGCELSRIL